MYHALETGVVATLLYLISCFLRKTGFISLNQHRKAWNIILAFTFVSTALAGIFLALQITYKWNIPFIKQILRIHVETGLGLAFTGLLHSFRHATYFFRKQEQDENIRMKADYGTMTPGIIRTNLFVAGFLSTSVQLLLMRESLNISGGYELTAGLFLGTWLIASLSGARAAPASSLNNLPKLNFVFIASPLVSLAMMILLSFFFLRPGETPSFLVSTIFTIITLFPFCFVSGFLFVKLLAYASKTGNIPPGTSFARETTGGIIAGILVAILTSGLINTYEILLLVLLLSADWTIKTFLVTLPRKKIIVSLSTITAVILVLLLDSDSIFRQLLLPGIKVKESIDTPYGNITTGSYGGKENLYYNHRLRIYSDDVAEREEDIHYGMLQSKSPKTVTLISGNPKSHVAEILKYNTRKIFYVEIDPEISRRTTIDKVPESLLYEAINKDGYRYIRRSQERSDVIILLVPPPSTLMLGRYYSEEFFKSARNKMNDGGVFVCSPGPSENYYNKESVRLYSSVYNTLRKNFRNVIPLAGNKLYFIASDSAVSTDICRMVTEKGVTNNWVSPDFLSDDLIAAKSKELTSLFGESATINKASTPSAVFYFQLFSLSRSDNEKIPALLLIAVLFALPVLSIRKIDIQMYLSASALAGFEIILLLAIQITAGSMYQLTGLIIAGFMTGLAIGSSGLPKIKILSVQHLRSLALVLFYSLAGIFSNYISGMGGTVFSTGLLILISLPPAILTGSLFSDLAARSNSSSNAAIVYGADLAGSAAGFIITAALIVPVVGITVSLFLFAGLILLSMAFGTIGRK